jgi:hypothetical protein
MLYLTVLGLEFLPTVLEHRHMQRPFFRSLLALLKKVTIVLVIAGIVISTLHQASLGSIFLITPKRLHPLWYSPVIYVLFFVSAVGLGFMTVTLGSLLSGYFFRRTIRTDLLSGLGVAAACMLGLYVALRVGDLGVRGRLGQAFDGSWQANLFLFELTVSALLPALLLAVPRVRTSVSGLGVCSGLTVLGMVLYRIDVCFIAFDRPEALSYFPSWMEFAVSLGILAVAALIFIFFVENLNVYDDGRQAPEGEAKEEGTVPVVTVPTSCGPVTQRALVSGLLADTRRYSLAVVVAAALAVVLLPEDVWGDFHVNVPVTPAQRVNVKRVYMEEDARTLFERTDEEGAETIMVIDGNRSGLFAIFPHQHHIDIMGADGSCVTCHHRKLPTGEKRSCAKCHRDMFAVTDTFNHRYHIAHLDGNRGCGRCHLDSAGIKNRETAAHCVVCHAGMVVEESLIKPKDGLRGLAPGYRDAMHGLCVGCHKSARARSSGSHMSRCDTCHTGKKL